MSAFRAAQVSFLIEGGLQLENLLSCEDRSRFLLTTLCVQRIAVAQSIGTVRIRVILFRIADHQFVLVVLDELLIIGDGVCFGRLSVQQSTVLIVVCLIGKGARVAVRRWQ